MNYLKIISEIETVKVKNKTRKYVICECECGNKKRVRHDHFLNNKIRSCGCRRTELLREKNVIHGKIKTGEYRSWLALRRRCYYEKDLRYKHYGGRGIEVCDRWKNSFVNFYSDMGDKPDKTYSIDRIDVNGNYEPTNCRWASIKEQSINKRK